VGVERCGPRHSGRTGSTSILFQMCSARSSSPRGRCKPMVRRSSRSALPAWSVSSGLRTSPARRNRVPRPLRLHARAAILPYCPTSSTNATRLGGERGRSRTIPSPPRKDRRLVVDAVQPASPGPQARDRGSELRPRGFLPRGQTAELCAQGFFPRSQSSKPCGQASEPRAQGSPPGARASEPRPRSPGALPPEYRAPCASQRWATVHPFRLCPARSSSIARMNTMGPGTGAHGILVFRCAPYGLRMLVAAAGTTTP
jgi:hypothetical protein